MFYYSYNNFIEEKIHIFFAEKKEIWGQFLFFQLHLQFIIEIFKKITFGGLFGYCVKLTLNSNRFHQIAIKKTMEFMLARLPALWTNLF